MSWTSSIVSADVGTVTVNAVTPAGTVMTPPAIVTPLLKAASVSVEV